MFFSGLIIVVIGFFLTYKAHPIADFFGSSAFAEKYLGMYGGTRLMVKLIGILAIIIGTLTMTGLIENILYAAIVTMSPGIGK